MGNKERGVMDLIKGSSMILMVVEGLGYLERMDRWKIGHGYESWGSGLAVGCVAGLWTYGL